MQFIHFIIVPLCFIIFMIVLQLWIGQDEFGQLFKLFGFGLICGVLLKILTSLFNPIFEGKAHHLTILMKSFFVDGILFSVILIVSLYILIDFFMDISSNANWLSSTLLTLSYIFGVFTIINITQSFSGDYPSSMLYYLAFIPFLILISFIIGFGIPKFLDTYNIFLKVMWGAATVIITVICFTLFNYLKFYNYHEYFYFLIPFVIISAAFEIREFRNIR